MHDSQGGKIMKKKIFIVGLTMMLTLSPMTAFGGTDVSAETIDVAEGSGVDLQGLSDEQVVALQKEINQEIMNRGIEKKAEVTPGTYTAGKDIPTGKYNFFSPTDNKTLGEITVTRADKNDDFLWRNAPMEEDFQHQFEMKEGDVLEVRRTGTLTMIAGGVKFE